MYYSQNEHVSAYGDRINKWMPNYNESPPGRQIIADRDGVSITDISKLTEGLMVTKGLGGL